MKKSLLYLIMRYEEISFYAFTSISFQKLTNLYL